MFRDISAAVQAAIAVHIEEFGARGQGRPMTPGAPMPR